MHREAAEAALGVYALLGAEHPRFAGWGLAVAEALLDGPREVAIVGAPDGRGTIALRRTALQRQHPGTRGRGRRSRRSQPTAPLLADRPLVDGRAAAYVCRGFVCDRPVTDPAELQAVAVMT